MSGGAPVVAVDGPSGTGKGTLCAVLARRLDWHLLDSGALYRAVALQALRTGTRPDDGPAVVALLRNLDVRFAGAGDGVVTVDGEDVSEAIRSESCGSAASELAAIPDVRAALLAAQRACRQPPGLIADGRDMGTVVFPDAALKVFLSASAEERARRRYNQLKQKGNSVNLARLLEAIARRDSRDAERSVSPLKPAPDAVLLDTTNMSISGVEDRVLALMRERGLG